MSSSLYDATLASLDFRTLLPGLWGLGTDEVESDQETIKGSGKGSAGTSSGPRPVGARSGVLVDELASLSMKQPTSRPRAPAAALAGDVPSGQGMARGKKRNNVGKNHKVRAAPPAALSSGALETLRAANPRSDGPFRRVCIGPYTRSTSSDMHLTRRTR